MLRLWFRDWCEQNGYNPYRDGLVIRTTIDSRMQQLATEALQEQMDFLDRTVGNGWARGNRRSVRLLVEPKQGHRRRIRPGLDGLRGSP